MKNTSYWPLFSCLSPILEIDPNCTLSENGEETPWHLFRECPSPMLHNQLLPDSWETDELLRLINKTKFLEALDYSDLQLSLHLPPPQ